jgi:hypothetical protein
MQGFKSPGHAQRFLSAYGPIAQHFRPRRHLLSAPEYRYEMGRRFQMWGEITGTADRLKAESGATLPPLCLIMALAQIS